MTETGNRRRVRPIRLPHDDGRRIEPISSAEMGFFGGSGFYLRIGVFGALAVVVFAVLGFRLWSLQVLQGPQYTKIANRQTVRYVDLPAPRGVIVDAKGRLLAGVTGRLVATAEPVGARAPRPARRLAAEPRGTARAVPARPHGDARRARQRRLHRRSSSASGTGSSARRTRR